MPSFAFKNSPTPGKTIKYLGPHDHRPYSPNCSLVFSKLFRPWLNEKVSIAGLGVLKLGKNC